MILQNPCLTCGACCAHFRVSFYWGESDESETGTVPTDYTEDITPFYKCMKGTNQKPTRCIALQGQVGTQVTCSIYQLRSTTCREFGVHWHHSAMHITPEELDRCNQARSAWGLPALESQISRFPFQQPASHQHHRTLIYPHLVRKARRGGRKTGGFYSNNRGA